MEQAPLISIIMPVYNAGVLLHTAVESVLRQSFADFELLLVDDGSTDGSAALAHELAKKAQCGHLRCAQPWLAALPRPVVHLL